MKKILTIAFILIINLGFSQRITVPSNYGEWYYPDLIQTNGTYSRPFPAKPGDTVLVNQVVNKQANGTANEKKAAEYIIWRYNKYTALMTSILNSYWARGLDWINN